ncbi:MAG TPA: haloacid dehalogenase type II [Stellaceae bacterium]|nr:haloacid dehalogenase type II [Stellaceae bacterium]
MPAAALARTAACVFDAYGTLFDILSATGRCRDALGDKAAPLGALWRTRQLEYSWLRSLMGAHADFWQVTGESLDYAMASLGIEDRALRERLMEMFRTIEAYPDAQRVLEALKQAGRPAAILSNGTPDMLRAAVESAGIGGLLDHVISIEEAGIYKPHARVYELVAKRLGVPADRVCFVSSNGWDAAGAAHFGFQAVWANRGSQPRERLPGRLAAELPNLYGLPDLLGL